MTDRTRSRHRAAARPSTPLSTLTHSVTDHVGSIGRGGVVLAMSGGLVATVALPAQAAGGPGVAPATAPLAVQPATAVQSGLLAVAGTAQTASPELTAPAAAAVAFETSAFAPVKKPRARVVSTSTEGSEARGESGSASGSSDAGSSRSGESGGFGNSKGSSIVAVAARYLGVPYVYGGTTPSGWDCSGATSYIYRQVGISIPRTSQQQLNASRRVSRSEAVPGDLVFFLSGGSVFHVGIYAGGNQMYDAQRTGKAFIKREIFSSSVVFGRF